MHSSVFVRNYNALYEILVKTKYLPPANYLLAVKIYVDFNFGEGIVTSLGI